MNLNTWLWFKIIEEFILIHAFGVEYTTSDCIILSQLWLLAMEQKQNNILYEMITSYEFHEWILNCHNILDFWSVIKMHHNPYYVIMDSTYLLKCLIEWLFLTWKVLWCHWNKWGKFGKTLMTIIWDIWWNMIFFENKVIYLFYIIIQVLFF